MGTEAMPPTTTLASLAEREMELFATAEQRLGWPFAMAKESTLLLTTFISSVSADRGIFIRCMAILKTHHTLALLSIARRHHIQAMMNLRQVVEASSSAAYALAHPAVNYIDSTTNLVIEPKNASRRSYKWIAENYSSHSEELRDIKEHLNQNATHFNIVNSVRIVPNSPEDNLWTTDFFDNPDTHHEQIDLWFLTLSALCTMHLLNEVKNTYGGLVFAPDFEPRANVVSSDWEKLKVILTASPRHQAATEKAVRANAK